MSGRDRGGKEGVRDRINVARNYDCGEKTEAMALYLNSEKTGGK